MKPVFLPEALEDYEGAVVYYEQREENLGARLVQEFDQATALLLEFPKAAPLVTDAPAKYGLRSIMLRSFPLKLVYGLRDDKILFVALFHGKRRPGYWKRRLARLKAA